MSPRDLAKVMLQEFTCDMEWYDTVDGRSVEVHPLQSRQYLDHLRAMKAMPYAEAVERIRGALRGLRERRLEFDPLWPFLLLDVRYRPNYWNLLKEEALVRRRDKRASALFAAAEREFADFGKPKKGRPRVDVAARRLAVRDAILSDTPRVLTFVRRVWRDEDRRTGAPTSTPAALVRFARRFCGGDKAIERAVHRAWAARTMRPQGLAVRLLRLKHGQRVPGLRDKDVLAVLPRAST